MAFYLEILCWQRSSLSCPTTLGTSTCEIGIADSRELLNLPCKLGSASCPFNPDNTLNHITPYTEIPNIIRIIIPTLPQ
jgi:hypothetical protein